jgi:hypothetical protein
MQTIRVEFPAVSWSLLLLRGRSSRRCIKSRRMPPLFDNLLYLFCQLVGGESYVPAANKNYIKNIIIWYIYIYLCVFVRVIYEYLHIYICILSIKLRIILCYNFWIHMIHMHISLLTFEVPTIPVATPFPLRFLRFCHGRWTFARRARVSKPPEAHWQMLSRRCEEISRLTVGLHFAGHVCCHKWKYFFRDFRACFLK